MSRPTLYIDRCLGKGVGLALRAVGATVVLQHEAGIRHDTTDEQWIPHVSEKGWVILTKDKGIRKPGIERDRVLRFGARVFTLTSGRLTGARMAEIFVAHLAEIERLAEATPPPFVAIVHEQLGVSVCTHIGSPASGEVAPGGVPPDPPASN